MCIRDRCLSYCVIPTFSRTSITTTLTKFSKQNNLLLIPLDTSQFTLNGFIAAYIFLLIFCFSYPWLFLLLQLLILVAPLITLYLFLSLFLLPLVPLVYVLTDKKFLIYSFTLCSLYICFLVSFNIPYFKFTFPGIIVIIFSFFTACCTVSSSLVTLN